MILVHIWCSKSQNYTAFQRRVYSLNHLWCFAVHICTFLVHIWRLSTNILDTFWSFLAAASMWAAFAYDIVRGEDCCLFMHKSQSFVPRQTTFVRREIWECAPTPHSHSNMVLLRNHSRLKTGESRVTRLAETLHYCLQVQTRWMSYAIWPLRLNSKIE